MWLTSVTVWLFPREGVAKSACRCGSASGIYNRMRENTTYVHNIKKNARYQCSGQSIILKFALLRAR